MQSITKQIEKLVDTEKKSLHEKLLKNNTSSEEAAMKIYEAGKCELHEVSAKNRQRAMSALPSRRGSWIPSMPMWRKA